MRQVYLLANAGADDEIIAGPVSRSEANAQLRDLNQANGDGQFRQRVDYFTIPASRFAQYARNHAIIADRGIDDDDES